MDGDESRQMYDEGLVTWQNEHRYPYMSVSAWESSVGVECLLRVTYLLHSEG